jgi:nucleotide-binding universal stress UspA family protein
MTTVLAVPAPGRLAQAILDVAESMGIVLEAEVRRLGPSGDTEEPPDPGKILAALDEPGSAGVVLPDTTLARLAWPVLQGARKPVIVVPSALTEDGHWQLKRALIPLDGTAEAADAVAEAVGLLSDAGVELLVLHVFDAGTVPRYWDHHGHADQVWQSEFLARYCDLPGARMQWRSGSPEQHVLDVASAEHADLVALGWSQRLDADHARIVRRTVEQSPVPVLLLPTRAGS